MEEGGAQGGNWDGLSPEVLVMIFQHLPIQDLMSCSVMSKNWKKAARDVLKRSRECYAHIKYFDQDIQDLNEMIASTDLMQMINGLRIRNERRPKEALGSDSTLGQGSSHCCSDVTKLLHSGDTGRKLEEAKQKIVSVLGGQWRYLDLDMGYGWRHRVSLDKTLLLREIILATNDSLQKLIMGQDIDWRFIPCCAKPFLKLKVIHDQRKHDTGWGRCFDYSSSKFAPNLDKFTGKMMSLDVWNPVGGFILERIKCVRVEGELELPEGEAKEIFECVSGLHRLDLQRYHCEPVSDDQEDQNIPSWNAFVFPFVLRSLNTLEELRMYTLELYNLWMASDGLTFPNLRRLSLATHGNVSMSSEISALKNLNLPQLCPNLEQLELKEDDHCGHDVEVDVLPGGEPNELDQSEMPVAIDLKCRRAFEDHDDGLYNHDHLEFFLTIYPKLNKVRILKLRNVVDYEMSKLFWEVQSLEYLEIQVCRPPYEIEFGLEALLCGINIEEAKLPLLKYQKKKDKLNSCIVPIRPSLLNARNLKELKITEKCLTCANLLMVRRSWVTQITENLPERHVRNMKVTFHGSKGLYDRLNRMRAFQWLRANKIRAKYLESFSYWSSFPY